MGNPWTPSLMSEDTTKSLEFTGVSTTSSNTTTTTTHSPPTQSTSQLEAATCYQPRLITSVGFSNSPSTNLTSSCWKQVRSEGWKSGPLATFWKTRKKTLSYCTGFLNVWRSLFISFLALLCFSVSLLTKCFIMGNLLTLREAHICDLGGLSIKVCHVKCEQ